MSHDSLYHDSWKELHIIPGHDSSPQQTGRLIRFCDSPADLVRRPRQQIIRKSSAPSAVSPFIPRFLAVCGITNVDRGLYHASSEILISLVQMYARIIHLFNKLSRNFSLPAAYLPDFSSNLYPIPQTVVIAQELLSGSFSRSLLMCTSTVRVSPRYS